MEPLQAGEEGSFSGRLRLEKIAVLRWSRFRQGRVQLLWPPQAEEDGSAEMEPLQTGKTTNVTHPSCVPQSGFVRGFNHVCGCICIPISGEPNKTQVFSFFQTDLGGLLPRSVVDSFFPSSMSEFYSNLTKAVKSLKDL